MATYSGRIRPPALRTVVPVLVLALLATAAFTGVVSFEWRLLDLDPAVAPYFFGFALLAWAVTLLSVGYWYRWARGWDEPPTGTPDRR